MNARKARKTMHQLDELVNGFDLDEWYRRSREDHERSMRRLNLIQWRVVTPFMLLVCGFNLTVAVYRVWTWYFTP